MSEEEDAAAIGARMRRECRCNTLIAAVVAAVIGFVLGLAL